MLYVNADRCKLCTPVLYVNADWCNLCSSVLYVNADWCSLCTPVLYVNADGCNLCTPVLYVNADWCSFCSPVLYDNWCNLWTLCCTTVPIAAICAPLCCTIVLIGAVCGTLCCTLMLIGASDSPFVLIGIVLYCTPAFSFSRLELRRWTLMKLLINYFGVCIKCNFCSCWTALSCPPLFFIFLFTVTFGTRWGITKRNLDIFTETSFVVSVMKMWTTLIMTV